MRSSSLKTTEKTKKAVKKKKKKKEDNLAILNLFCNAWIAWRCLFHRNISI